MGEKIIHVYSQRKSKTCLTFHFKLLSNVSDEIIGDSISYSMPITNPSHHTTHSFIQSLTHLQSHINSISFHFFGSERRKG